MPGYVIAVDVFGLILAVIGFNMAFRQRFVRRLIGRPARPPSRIGGEQEDDPLTYILRISGIMIMAFGIALGAMLTIFHLA
jgi:hypothetical protein